MVRAVPVKARTNPVAIGSRIRAARQASQMTIEQLSQATGLSKGFISRVERDQTSPSVSTLIQICDVLHLPVGELFHEPESYTTSIDSAPVTNMGGEYVDERLLTPRSERRLQVISTRVRTGEQGTGGAETYTLHSDLEVLHVIKGTITFELNGQTHTLRSGDTFTFSGHEPHTWIVANTEEDTELLWVLSPAP